MLIAFAFVCFVWLSEQTVPFTLYIINRLVFITQAESVYCAAVAYRGGILRGVQTPPPPRNPEDVGGVLDRMSKKNRRPDFLL